MYDDLPDQDVPIMEFLNKEKIEFLNKEKIEFPIPIISVGVTSTMLQKMIDDKIIREVGEGYIKRYGKVFFVYEVVKHRLRVIFWPKEVNDNTDYEAELEDMMSTLEQMAQVHRGDYARCYDAMCGFYQMILSETVQPFHGFRTEDGKNFVFNRAGMGHKPQAELMHTIMRICAESRQTGSTRTNVHIDNVRFLDGPEDVDEAARIFLENCAFVGITLNKEPVNERHQKGDYCGVRYDYANAMAQATPKSIVKLRAAATKFFETGTVSAAFELFGLLFHLSAILRAPIGDFYHTMKCYRKRTGAFATGNLGLDDQFALWRCVYHELDTWLEFIYNNVSVHRPTGGVATYILFTDASNDGWGAYLIAPDGSVRVVGGRWNALERARSINEREAMAVENAVRTFSAVLRGSKVEIRIDNTSVVYGISRGYSRVFNLNQRLADAVRILEATEADISVSYVRSEHNKADWASRNAAQLPSASGRLMNG